MGRKELRRRRELADELRAAQENLAAELELVALASCGSLEFAEDPAVTEAWAVLAADGDGLSRAYKRFTRAGMAAAEHLREAD